MIAVQSAHMGDKRLLQQTRKSDDSGDGGDEEKWINSEYILEFLLMELAVADDRKRGVEDEVFLHEKCGGISIY